MAIEEPILYLITSGETTSRTEPTSPEFDRILKLTSAAARAGIHLIQLREKNLRARVLYELAARASEITHDTATRILINDRADVARAAQCDGVHLTARSIEAHIIRQTFGADFLIGVSTHSIEEARKARNRGADFAVFGPVFDTPSKRAYGTPLGLDRLREATSELSPFPVIAIGGITRENATQVISAGASGVAAIRLFSEPDSLKDVVREIRG